MSNFTRVTSDGNLRCCIALLLLVHWDAEFLIFHTLNSYTACGKKCDSFLIAVLVNRFEYKKHMKLKSICNKIPFNIRSLLLKISASRKVAGLFPDGVIGIFHWQNPSGRTVLLGFTQVLKNEYEEYFLGGKGGPVRRADSFTTFMCRLS